MSTRIGITLPENLYKLYKEMLFMKNRTIQDDLSKRIEEAVKEYQRSKINEQ